MVVNDILSPPPLSPYGTFNGSLFQYKNNLVAFESLPPREPQGAKKCILVGGLSDGLIPTPYTKKLEESCHEVGWSLVQPILSSSYLGFGNGSLDRDTEEISALLSYLTTHRSAEHFALVGHSTGCQNSVHFIKNGPPELVDKTKVVVLQAPVSDREGAMEEPNYTEMIELARDMVKNGKSEEVMPRKAFWAPITAKRLLDLQDKGGADDFFSSDFTDDELAILLGHMGCSSAKVLVAFSGSDEYVPETVDCKQLSERLCKAMNSGGKKGVVAVGGAAELYLPKANHNLSTEGGEIDIFVEGVTKLLKEVA